MTRLSHHQAASAGLKHFRNRNPDDEPDPPPPPGVSSPFRILNAAQLGRELGPLRGGHRACYRTICRWVRRGMPSYVQPETGHRVFLLHEVVEWLLGRRESRSLEVEVTDLSYLNTRCKTKRAA